jgi:hypothetical protein
MSKLFQIIGQLVQRIRQLAGRDIKTFRGAPPALDSESPVMDGSFTINEAIVKELMRRLQATQEDAYSCEETFALLDEYVELLASNKEAARLMPLVRNHIKMCPDCREACETLLSILEED